MLFKPFKKKVNKLHEEEFREVSGSITKQYVSLIWPSGDIEVSFSEGKETTYAIAGPVSLVESIRLEATLDTSRFQMQWFKDNRESVYAISPTDERYNDVRVRLVLGKGVKFRTVESRANVHLDGPYNQNLVIG